MIVSLTVNYVLEADDRNDFYDVNTGRLLESMHETLVSRYPKEIKLSDNVRGRINDLTYVPLEEGKNCFRCSACGKYLSDLKYVYLGIDYWQEIDGEKFCCSCAWEREDELRHEEDP